jgi:hypothetical protein
MIESYSHEQLLVWVNEAKDPQPHVLVVATKRGMRHGFIHQTERHARARMMEFQSFDPDLIHFEFHRPATSEEIARPLNGNLLFEESL